MSDTAVAERNHKLKPNTLCWVVFCWLRFDVHVVGVYPTKKAAEQGRLDWIASHPDPEWEKVSHERTNNTIIVKRYSGKTVTQDEATWPK